MQNNFFRSGKFMSMEDNYEESKIIVYGVGFDGTTSNRPGTRFAPLKMRNEFDGLETYSPIIDLDLEDFKVCDCGDLELSIGNTDLVLDEIYKATKNLITDNKVPVMIGGEHLVTLPAFKAVYEKYSDVNVIHLDAHTDLREEYNNSKNSHATVIKRVWDIVGDDRIYQFGIRSGTKEEFIFAKNHTYLELGDVQTFDEKIKELSGKNVYITIDLDVFDTSIFSGTGTPEPGGINYREFNKILLAIKNSNINIVGLDIVELSPDYDSSACSTTLACKVLRDTVLVLAEKIYR